VHAENEKRIKHHNYAERGTIIPFGIESTGALAPSAQRFLDGLDKSHAKAKKHFRHQLQRILAKYNAAMFHTIRDRCRRQIDRISRFALSTDAQYHRQRAATSSSSVASTGIPATPAAALTTPATVSTALVASASNSSVVPAVSSSSVSSETEWTVVVYGRHGRSRSASPPSASKRPKHHESSQRCLPKRKTSPTTYNSYRDAVSSTASPPTSTALVVHSQPLCQPSKKSRSSGVGTQ
jgi:hypothetical protein